MSGQRPTLRRLRPWVSCAGAVLVGLVAYLRVAPIEPHLEWSRFLDLDSAENQSWLVDLVARGGGSVRDIVVTADHPQADVMNARVAELVSSATLAARVRISPRPDRSVNLTVRYTSGGEERTFTLPLTDER